MLDVSPTCMENNPPHRPSLCRRRHALQAGNDRLRLRSGVRVFDSKITQVSKVVRHVRIPKQAVDGTGVKSDGTMSHPSPISRRFTAAGAPTRRKTHHNLPVAFLCWNARRRRCCGLQNGAVGSDPWEGMKRCHAKTSDSVVHLRNCPY